MTACNPAGHRYLALFLPFLPTETLRASGRVPVSAGPDSPPLVLVEMQRGAMRLASVDARGLALGLHPGMTLADARARLPGLPVHPADPARDAAALAVLAAESEMFTPMVAIDLPHGLMLDITGCAHLFGGEAGLMRRIRQRFRQRGYSPVLALAPTPDAARALARFGGRDCLSAEAAETRVLPVAALEAGEETLLALTRAGLKDLAALEACPPGVLAARFGAGLVTKLRRVLGQDNARITPLRHLPECLAERHFPEPVLAFDAVLALVRRLAGDLARMLEARGEGGRRFELSLFRSDGQVRRLVVETGHPCRDPDVIERLLALRIEALADPVDPGFGFDSVRLAVLASEAFGQVQPDFDGHRLEDLALEDLIDRLSTRFGAARVLRAEAEDTHDPVRAARFVPAQSQTAPSLWPEPEPGEGPRRPIRLFEPPQAIEALAEVPDGPPLRFRWRRVLHEVARAEGPERIAPEWWRVEPGTPSRDYYRIEDSQGRRFWVFRQGFYGQSGQPPRWFLHGLFA
ncbi:MAG: DNA polymerase Y family protein [Beijerinckiaceae bacterium]|nr:DNA polymerase Y family protein [Beijerinckiaceae bacterium]